MKSKRPPDKAQLGLFDKPPDATRKKHPAKSTARTADDYSDDICQNRHGGNPESKKAFGKARKGAAIARARILEHARLVGTITSDEVEIALGMPHQSASARCSELRRSKELIPTGEHRKTRTGCDATVLKPS